MNHRSPQFGPLEVHAGRAKIVFCDGHVEAKRRTDIIGQRHQDPAVRRQVARVWNPDNEPFFDRGVTRF
ncbi:MAG TPA: hypothetical protein DCE44_20715 [Verrucomicrobiales bacterium]|nr:hypothetical protein [Verrucomicrobiales bacterium]